MARPAGPFKPNSATGQLGTGAGAELAQRSAREAAEDPPRAVEPGRPNELAVGAPHDVVDAAAMAAEDGQCRSRADVPDAGRPVVARRHDDVAAGAEGGAVHDAI